MSKPTPPTQPQAQDAVELEIAEVLEEAKKTSSPNELAHIIWLAQGIDIWHRTGGKRGHSLEDATRYIASSLVRLIAAKLTSARLDSAIEEASKVTRLEVVDHTRCELCSGSGRWHDTTGRDVECPKCAGMGSPGRDVVFWDANKQIELSYQDDGRTLKIFVSDRKAQLQAERNKEGK